MEANKYVKTVTCSSYQLRALPSKHFAYEIHVKWSSGQSAVIYRRYSQFFNLQCKLLDTFPLEAGTYDPSKRKLPFLPGKKVLGNLSEKIAAKRRAKFDVYLKELILLANVGCSALVLNFFESRESDLVSLLDRKNSRSSITSVKGRVITSPIAFPQYIMIEDYVKSQKGELSASAGTVLFVIEKKHTGWWLAQTQDGEVQGWVPATYLDPLYESTDSSDDEYSLPAEPEKFVVTSDYVGGQADELSVHRGCVVEVITKSMDGWWSCRYEGKEGMFPSAYLRKANTLKAKELIAISKQLAKEHYAASNVQSMRRPDSRKELSHYAPPRRDLNKQKPPRPSAPPTPKPKACRYMVVADFTNTMNDGVDLTEGELIQVLTKDDSGWWFVEVSGVKGWAPSTYIQTLNEEESPVAKSKPARPGRPPSSKSSPKIQRKLQHQTSSQPAPTAKPFDRRASSPKPLNHSQSSPKLLNKSTQPAKPLNRNISTPKPFRYNATDAPNSLNSSAAVVKPLYPATIHGESSRGSVRSGINRLTQQSAGARPSIPLKPKISGAGSTQAAHRVVTHPVYYSEVSGEEASGKGADNNNEVDETDARLTVAELRKRLAANLST